LTSDFSRIIVEDPLQKFVHLIDVSNNLKVIASHNFAGLKHKIVFGKLITLDSEGILKTINL